MTKRVLRPATVLLALCLGVAALPWAVHAEEAASSGAIRPIGTLERIPADVVAVFGPEVVPPGFFDPPGSQARNSTSGSSRSGTMIVLPHVRQLWQFFPFEWQMKTGIVVRDLDTMRIRTSFVYPGSFQRATTQSGGEWMHATDGRSRLFLLSEGGAQVVEYDLHTMAHRTHPIGAPKIVAGRSVIGAAIGGMTYDAATHSVFFLIGFVGSLNVANTNTFIARLDVRTDVWEVRDIRSCSGPLPSTDQSATYSIPVLLLVDEVFVPCHRAGMVGTVVRMPRDTLFEDPLGPEDVAIGPVYLETVLVDQVGQRLYLVTILGEMWVFDPKTMSFVGVVAAHSEAKSTVSVGYGLDPETGRVFFQSATYGFGVADGRFFPIPQARTYPQARSRGQERIQSDARTGRIFVLTEVNQSKPSAYTIYSAGRAPLPPAPPDPDRNTADIEEAAGKTESKYFASGSGYGVRAIMAKGLATAAPAPTAGVQAPTAQVINDNVNSKCGYTDRELVAGRVAQAEYDTGSSSAMAAAVDVDERTKQDLERLSRCDVTVRNGNEVFRGIYSMSPDLPDEGRPWRYLPASCSAGHEGAQDANGDDQGEKSLGTSSVECPEPGGKLHAEAYADLTQGAVKVGNAFTVVDIAKESGNGVVSTVRSVARDIDVAGVIHIAEVDSRAVSRAKGRPARDDAPMSSYTTVISGVTIAGKSICELRCDTETVLAALNQAAGGRAQFRASSGLDKGLLKGTPRGALTAVQKLVERQVSDQALVGDSSKEVPGLEMIVYNDNTKFGRARQVYQFAGVTTTANYNIVPLPSFADLLDDDDPGRPDGLALDVPTADDGSSLAIGLDGLGSGESASSGSGGILGRVAEAFRALARGFKLLVTDPRRAFLVLTAWAVLMVPPALNRRRRLLLEARSA